MKLKYKYGRCEWCGRLVRLYNIDKCNPEKEIFCYDCPNCHGCGITEAINPNTEEIKEIFNQFPDEKSERDITLVDTDVDNVADKMINDAIKSNIETFTIQMDILQTIIRKLMWRQELNTAEKDIVVKILEKEKDS